ncbi:CHAD domain-containing protein [Paraburkholderia silviterrae]|uniref:CHAD domain-containing protein n=2 Tax=Paraburkholderia silviterrae TaxID=2528715 RepID=A0A4V2ZXS3_9BURK|nr:CHAD domain-containing protein [Paraburkholderia silviterrae]TDG16459.1 CHAD domain-containing protein [Paraburkholderia silviterrae]
MSHGDLNQLALPEPSAVAAFGTLAEPLVAEALAQADAIVRAPSAEGLHQLRVALRRLRSLWWSYRPLLDAGENSRQRELFKSLADTAGKARDYDILIELLQLQRERNGETPPALSEVRHEALDTGREVFSNPDMKALLLDALSQSSEALKASQNRRSLKAFADARVTDSEKQLRKRMRHAAKARKPDVAAFHDVRKAGKKVRYLLELFGPVLSGRHQKTLDRLKKIQKRFGELNDVVASEALLRDNTSLLSAMGDPESTLKWLRKERKRRLRAAAALLRSVPR